MRIFFSRDHWTPEKAYLLGLLSSQVRLAGAAGRRRALAVAAMDLPLLYWLRTTLNSRARIARRGGFYHLRFTNQRLLAGLARIGAEEGLASLLGRLPAEQRPHFVRGYFDSRGKVSLVRVEGVLHLRSFFPGLAGDVAALAGVLRRHAKIRGSSKTRGEARTISLNSRESLRLHDWMYHSACFYLEGKKSVFERFLAQRALARERVGA